MYPAASSVRLSLFAVFHLAQIGAVLGLRCLVSQLCKFGRIKPQFKSAPFALLASNTSVCAAASPRPVTLPVSRPAVLTHVGYGFIKIRLPWKSRDNLSSEPPEREAGAADSDGPVSLGDTLALRDTSRPKESVSLRNPDV